MTPADLLTFAAELEDILSNTSQRNRQDMRTPTYTPERGE